MLFFFITLHCLRFLFLQYHLVSWYTLGWTEHEEHRTSFQAPSFNTIYCTIIPILAWGYWKRSYPPVVRELRLTSDWPGRNLLSCDRICPQFAIHNSFGRCCTMILAWSQCCIFTSWANGLRHTIVPSGNDRLMCFCVQGDSSYNII